MNVKTYKSKYIGTENEFILKIINIDKEEDKISFKFKGKEKLIGKLYLKESINNTYELGDYVKVKGNLKEPINNTIPNTFNYKKYLNNQKIFFILEIENIELYKKNKNIFYKLKNKVIERINLLRNKEFIYAFVIGNTSYIEEDINKNFRINGVSHLFAISGMHVSFLTGFIFLILSYLRVLEIKKYYITFSFLMLFAFLTGFSPSVLRSSLFFFLSGINSLKRLKIDSLTLLLIVLNIILIVNPIELFSLSLQLSFIVTFFIIYYGTSEEDIYFKKLLKTSLISFLASLPLIININYEINLLTIINNLVFVPLVSIVVYPLCMFNFLFPFLDSITAFFINVLINLNEIFSSCSLILIFPKISLVIIMLYYALLFLYKKLRKKIIVYLFVFLIVFNFVYVKYKYQYRIYYLDVGQGDSTLLMNGQTSILIDTGGIINFNSNESYLSNNLITFFKSIGLNSIDYMVLTHGDYDHMGEAINLVNNFKIEKVIFNCGEFNKLEDDLIEVLNDKKITYYSCIKELNIDDNKLYFLNNGGYGNENDNSLVIYTELNNYKFLFMGDTSVEVEKDLIEKYKLQDVDVLKVGHHGSDTSSSKEFIDEINPKYSIISVGKNNRYGHPNKKVLDNLKDSNVYRTDINGSVMVKIKNDNLTVETCVS